MRTGVNESTFEREVLQGSGLVLVDFWAEWCTPCRAVSPILERIADEHDLKLVEVNFDEERRLTERYGVLAIPNMLLFENGELKAQAIGAQPKRSLERALGLAA